MEIERKYLVKTLPQNLEQYEAKKISQGYLCTGPVVRIRRSNDDYYLTYKGKGLLAREEYNLPLTQEAYFHLKEKADGIIISKKRYLIPIAEPCFSDDYQKSEKMPALKIELDIFDAPLAPLIIAEVEFPDEEMANAFLPPAWLGEDVTNDPNFHNSNLSRRKL